MKNLVFAWLLALAAPAAAQPASPPAATLDAAAETALIDRAAALLGEKKPAEAIALLDQVIAAEEKAHAGDTRQIFAARSAVEMIMYAGMGGEAKRDTIVLGPEWSLSIFLKGYALIDLGSHDAAKPLLDKAVAMSPLNSHFLGEVGEWHKTRGELVEAYGYFERALSTSEFSPEEFKSFDKRRALRGLGWVLIEQGKLDEAERMYRKALKIDANDAGAKQELEYIRQQRGRRS